ncbi:MAG: DUF167 domain-containing protein [Patescibacteria group bacterium]
MYVKVRVYPGMKKEKVTEIGPHHYECILKAPAKRNLANERLREIIADIYKVALPAVRIVTGHRSPSKLLEVSLPTHKPN